VPCTEQGIRDAIAAGGGAYSFGECEGPVVTDDVIVINNDVFLDGEERVTVDGNDDHVVFLVEEDVSATLWGFTITGGDAHGIQNHGMLTLTHSAVSGNADAGISNEDGQVTVLSSTLSSNGSGVTSESHSLSQRNTLVVTNSTISGNAGYGILSRQSETIVTYTTITGNGSWGIWNEGSDLVGHGPMTVAKSIVADGCEDGPIISDGYNIESPGDTCGFDQTGDQSGVTSEQLNLGPLQVDGSSGSATHALLPGSVAIDVIPEEACELDEDQRGVSRPGTDYMMACDVGAFERWSGDDG